MQLLFNKNKLIYIIIYLNLLSTGEADLLNYWNKFKTYIYPFQQTNTELQNENNYMKKIPYEVSVDDEKFITEAATLTGVALSKLDSCQQRVVLKLQVDCHKMNDEQLAKMAVHLLNCQSYAEGRKLYPCTDQMSIKDCTTSMDSDTWTSYHLMSNRARAVCYSVRQIQFRGLAESTVNRLMETAQNQLQTLNKIRRDQENLRDIAESTIDKLGVGHDVLLKQQNDLREAQFFGQLTLEDNIRKLSDEKRFIVETHNQLVEMTRNVKEKLEDSTKQMEDQADQTRLNHKELIDDLIEIQEKTHNIFRKIEESSDLLIKQNNEFKLQYESTLKNLAEVNKTVHNLVTLVGGTRQVLEERLSWITKALGGTDLAVERLYLITWHFLFILLSMIICAFLSAHFSTRFIVASLPPLNLLIALYGSTNEYFQPFGLLVIITTLILVQNLISYALKLTYHKPKFAISWQKGKSKTESTQSSPITTTTTTATTFRTNNYTSSTPLKLPNDDDDSTVDYVNESLNEKDELLDEFNNFNPTPPLSRSGYYPLPRSRSNTPLTLLNRSLSKNYKCQAMTRKGTPCKLVSAPGRSYCFRHQTGDSIIG